MIAKWAIELGIQWFYGFPFWWWLPFTLASPHGSEILQIRLKQDTHSRIQAKYETNSGNG